MSIDYYIYLKQIEQFSSKAFSQYCDSIGLCVAIHPEFDIVKESGFIPVRFTDKRFVKTGENFDFLSGFELFFSEYHRYELKPKEEPKVSFESCSPRNRKRKVPLIVR